MKGVPCSLVCSNEKLDVRNIEILKHREDVHRVLSKENIQMCVLTMTTTLLKKYI